MGNRPLEVIMMFRKIPTFLIFALTKVLYSVSSQTTNFFHPSVPYIDFKTHKSRPGSFI